MIVLDTNVLSELMRAGADTGVLAWLTRQPSTSLFTTTISEAEIRLGLAYLPAGKRRMELEHAANGLFSDFGERVLPFNSDATVEYASIGSARRMAGRPIAVLDAQIAAIVRSRGATLATRNVRDFERCGIPSSIPGPSSCRSRTSAPIARAPGSRVAGVLAAGDARSTWGPPTPRPTRGFCRVAERTASWSPRPREDIEANRLIAGLVVRCLDALDRCYRK